jgi:hypothetical protein
MGFLNPLVLLSGNRAVKPLNEKDFKDRCVF